MHFVYMDEDSIEHLLKCKICSKPFIDPVITRDGDRFCRLCITEKSLINYPSEYSQQSSFIESLVPITEKILLEMLDNLLVKCPDCQKLNLLRKDFPQHLLNECPERIISCKASDLKCPWNGSYNEYNDHVKKCTFELLRPILSETLQYKKQFEEYRIYYNEQQNEIIELKKQIEQYEDRLEKLQKGFKAFLDLNIQQKLRYEKFQNDIQQIYEQFKEQYNQISIHLHEFQQTKNELLNEIELIKKQVNQYDLEIKNIQEFYSNSDKQIKQLQKQDQQQSNEILHMRQLSDQHQVQIYLLARKKCVVPRLNAYTDTQLEEFIVGLESNSEIDLNGRNIDYQDMELVCKTAIIDKQCRKLRLENNDITAKGIRILAEALYGNITLVELHLSNNCISDMGVHALAQVLSINNSTLKCLEIHSNNITDEGAEYLAEMLKTNKTLSLLGLNSNQISDWGVHLLTSAITCYNETIQRLYLASNTLITDISLDNFVEMLTYNRSLQALSLNDCSLSTDAVKKLKQVVASNTNFILEI